MQKGHVKNYLKRAQNARVLQKELKNVILDISPPMFLYSLEVVRATDFEIAKTVEIAIVQILDENCKFCKTDSKNVFVLDK